MPRGLPPRPADDVRFLQGLLEGIARIEAQGYRRLAELGSPYLVSVRTVGGGARNEAWTSIRRRALDGFGWDAAHRKHDFGEITVGGGDDADPPGLDQAGEGRGGAAE